jgi:hypothetical protein
MPLNQMSFNQMSLNQMSLSQMSLSQMSLSQMSFNKMLLEQNSFEESNPHFFLSCVNVHPREDQSSRLHPNKNAEEKINHNFCFFKKLILISAKKYE